MTQQFMNLQLAVRQHFSRFSLNGLTLEIHSGRVAHRQGLKYKSGIQAGPEITQSNIFAEILMVSLVVKWKVGKRKRPRREKWQIE
jgi:hypothetical protein